MWPQPKSREYADMYPRVAALNIHNLPEPELCPPPNRPDRRLHTGYWSAGRAGGVGMESGFVRQVVEAYDWTCTAKGAARGLGMFDRLKRHLPPV